VSRHRGTFDTQLGAVRIFEAASSNAPNHSKAQQLAAPLSAGPQTDTSHRHWSRCTFFSNSINRGSE
jgi:hypothetical protein